MTDTTPQLSEREREILAYVANGSTNQQIANDLGISVNTVKVHVRNIFGKIGVASRAEATLYAVRTGVVSVDIAQPAVAVADDDDPPSNGATLVVVQPTADAPDSPRTAAPIHPAPPSEAAHVTPSAPPRSNRPIVWLAVAGIALLVTIGLVVFATQSNSQPVAPVPPSVPTVAQGGSGPGPVEAAPRPQWQLLKPLGAEQRAAAASITGGMMYVLGGANESGVTGAVWQYSPESDTWQAQATKPTAVQHVHGAVLNGKIHVPGGELADGSVSDVLEIFDPAQNTWSTAARMPAPRSGYGLVAFEGKLYLIGGWDGSAVTDTTFVYDPDRDTWTEAARMASARAYMGAAVADGQIFVLGGPARMGKH
ncbi:MAG: LuxR family transcriptional regulator [Chloroflexaceae bacterium]|nr:LuxR family transcriptional regulator [Chloroflexaceae bacterium]